MSKFYVLFIWGDVEPQLHGPYDTPDARDDMAIILKAGDGDESGIYPAEIDEAGGLHVGTYSGAFFEGCD